jgi:hypothetical protein
MKMKRTVVVLLLLVFAASTAFSQQKTLISNENLTLGGYFSPVVKFSSIHDDLGVFVGGRGGLIINRSVAIGFGGYGLASYVEAINRGPLGERYMEMGYGGLDIEYIFDPNELVHFSVSTLIGGGGVFFNDRSWGSDYWDDHDHDVNGFFIVEPAFNLDINVTSFMKTSIGASYRIVSGLKSDVSTNNDLTGASAMLSFRFGKF